MFVSLSPMRLHQHPDCAAVTFVALGNGAPDLSANIAAISAGEVTLSAGAFTGAAMFVQVRMIRGWCGWRQSCIALSNFQAADGNRSSHSPNTSSSAATNMCACAAAAAAACGMLQCVVAAELVGLAGDNGIKCGGAMLRDVGVYCLAIMSVLLAFSLGQVRSERGLNMYMRHRLI